MYPKTIQGVYTLRGVTDTTKLIYGNTAKCHAAYFELNDKEIRRLLSEGNNVVVEQTKDADKNFI